MTPQTAPPGDPTFSEDQRPIVGRPVSNRGPWLFGGGLVLAGLLLFSALEARRTDVVSPATSPVREPAGTLIAPPPALAVPGGAVGEYDPYAPNALQQAPLVPSLGPQFYPPPPGPPRIAGPRSIPGPPIARAPQYYDPNSPDAMAPSGPRGVPIAPSAVDAPERPAPSGDRLAGGRVGATRLLNPANTVPQGTVIQAVLETALDSNRPGFARAIVSRDVRSFDGTKVLIPRGSRLFGEYKADLADGQDRAFVNWQKLTRPDGAQIAVESPAADPLGRAGVKGDVNSHFFQRFAGAVLQSALDIGVGLATRSANNGTVVVGLPGSTQQLIQPSSRAIRPTLKVRQGSSVSVFVARDLDFSTVQ